MKYAINVPNFGEYHSAELVSNLAVEAEDAGWDAFFTWDHLQWDGQIGDPLVTLTTIATRTNKIKLGPMICPLPRRRPWKVAVEYLSLDHLSKGRLIFGVGLGAPPEEFTNFGENASPRARARKLDESLDILNGLWSGESFTYDGNYFHINQVKLGKTYQERIPIWVAGFLPSIRPFVRASKYDGVYPGRNWPEVFTVEDMVKVKSIIGKHRTIMENYDIVAGGETVSEPEEGSKLVQPWRDVGATWWSENINGWRGSLEDMCKRIRAGPPKI